MFPSAAEPLDQNFPARDYENGRPAKSGRSEPGNRSNSACGLLHRLVDLDHAVIAAIGKDEMGRGIDIAGMGLADIG